MDIPKTETEMWNLLAAAYAAMSGAPPGALIPRNSRWFGLKQKRKLTEDEKAIHRAIKHHRV